MQNIEVHSTDSRRGIFSEVDAPKNDSKEEEKQERKIKKRKENQEMLTKIVHRVGRTQIVSLCPS